MRAMVLSRSGPIEQKLLALEERPEPVPGPGETVIAIEACGVCRTDLHILEGEVPARLPVVLGHQAVGRVLRLGPGVENLAVGTAVGVGWMFETCGRCGFCRSGRENLCPNARNTGRHADGGYAEMMVAKADFFFRLPDALPAREAAPLLCAGVIGYRSLKLSGILPGQKLGLVGFGASAHLAIQVARHWGCEIFVFTREERHRRLARDLGARWAGQADEDPGKPLDAAVLFAPAGELVPQILPRLSRGASLAINAIHMSPIPALGFDDLYWEKSLLSVSNYTRRDAEEFLKLAAEIPVRASVEEFPLGAAADALRRIKRGEIRGAAVLVP
jgi:propanol-preferring alcohol dehydrogenase